MAADDTPPRDEDRATRRGRTRVVVADDNARYRAGIVRALGRRSDLEVVGEAEDGLAALDAARRLLPDVLVADLRMPGLDGLALSRAATEDPALAGVRVLLLSAWADDDLDARAAAAGAVGCVDKAEPRAVIADAVARAVPSPLGLS